MRKRKYTEEERKILNREKVRKWYKNNREKAIASQSEWHKNNPQSRKKSSLKTRNALKDGYIIEQLMANYGYKKEDITQEVIEIMRTKLTLKRAIRSAINSDVGTDK